ncbi:hypothetical protein CUMW_221440, partial [Citrus unshiu]
MMLMLCTMPLPTATLIFFVEVLNMGLVDLNLKDARGRTVLHVAARRKEPAVMVTLLSKGACASETTSDGQTAGQETNKDRLCIDVLEREMRRNSVSENLAMSSEVMDDDFQRKLDYLENRAACVRLFPSVARVAMEMAVADTTTGLSVLGRKGLSRNLKEVDLNETPSMQATSRQLRLLTLLKTVEMGQRFLPHCSEVAEVFMDCYFLHFSEVVDEFLDCGWSDASFLEKGTPEEQKIKRAYFMKLKEDMQKALCKDVAYHRRSGMLFQLPSSLSALYKYMAESNRSVAFARLLFPSEARVAMDRADADATNFYTGLSASKSKGSSGNLKEVDLNETPSMQAKRLQLRLQALLKTSRHYFPRCSKVDCDWSDASLLEKGTLEEQKLKRARFMVVKEDVKKAFYKDMAEKNRSGLSSSSSSSSFPKEGVKCKGRREKKEKRKEAF